MGGDQQAGEVHGGGQVVRQPRDQREGEGRPLQEAPFDGRRHGTGIEDVIAEVGAQVDTRDHHVRQFLQQAVQAQVHAVGRRAVEADESVVQALRVQRAVQRQGTAGAALVLVGGDHYAIGMIRQRVVKRGDTGCGHPVVVGNQYAHGFSVCPVGTRSRISRTTTVAKQPAGRTNSSCRTSGSG